MDTPLVTRSTAQNILSPPGNSLAVYVSLQGILMVKDIYGKIQPLADFLSASGIGVTSLSYEQATALVNAQALVPYAFYYINDFQTIYDQPDYDINKQPKNVVATKSGAVMPILIQAASTTSFFSWALQPQFPNDKLQFDFTYSQTEVMGEPAKGRITERIDSDNNRTDYDHRVVQFKRYANPDDAGNYNAYWDTGQDSEEVFTFNNPNTENNWFANYLPVNDFLLSNNVFSGKCTGNKFNQFYNNTVNECVDSQFLGTTTENILKQCVNVSTYAEFQINFIDQSFANNQITGDFSENTIGQSFRDNIIKGDFYKNTIGNDFFNNTVHDFENSTVGANCQNNIFLDSATLNQIGANMKSNIVKGSFNENTILDNFQNNSTQAFLNNNIGSMFQYNNVTSAFEDNLIADNFINNQVFANLTGCTFANGAVNNTFTTALNVSDFTAATHVYEQYNCTILLNASPLARLSYVDATDTIIFVDILT